MERLAVRGYWPARAARHLAEGKYSSAVEICREHLHEQSGIVSGRIIYAAALYLTGQLESASEQFYHVLSLDPDNIVALKYLGDIEFQLGDEVAALASYRRVLEIDPHCRGLASELNRVPRQTTRTIIIARGEEITDFATRGSLRRLPFYTETIGDLFLAQGYPRLAADVYRTLNENNENPRLSGKIQQAEAKIKHREQ